MRHTQPPLKTISSFWLVALLSFVFTISPPLLEAQTASPSASPTSQGTTEELKKRIEKAVEEKREQVKGAFDKLLDSQKGIIGEVQRVTDESITIENDTGKTIFTLSPSIVLEKNAKTITTDDVAVGNWVIIVGTQQQNGLIPEEMSFFNDTLEPKPQVVTLGSVTQLSATQVTILAKANGQEQTFTIARTSKYENNDGTAVTARDFTTGIEVLVVGVENQVNQTTTTELKVIRAVTPLN